MRPVPQGEAGRRVRQSSGLSSAACWPFAMLLGHTALSLYLTPHVTALLLCGWLRCTEWAAAAVGAAANDQQSNASVMCFSLSMTTIQLLPDNSSHRYQLLWSQATRHVPSTYRGTVIKKKKKKNTGKSWQRTWDINIDNMIICLTVEMCNFLHIAALYWGKDNLNDHSRASLGRTETSSECKCHTSQVTACWKCNGIKH